MYADILVEINSIEQTFTYKIPNNLVVSPGQRVLIPFGKRTVEGFVIKTHNKEDHDYNIKNIISTVDEKPVINDEMLELGKYISKKNLSSLMSAYQTMLPAALKAKNRKKASKKYVKYIIALNDKNIKTQKQKELYEMIKKNGETLKSNIKSKAILKTLLENKNLKEIDKEVYRLNEETKINKLDLELTNNQKQVLNNIDLTKFEPYLIHGVTGSGKTLVYIKLIEKILKLKKEAILLVPEISLTPQMVKIFKNHFGKIIAILHSGLSDGEKYDEWRKIERKEVSIVIGARSAIFAPFTNLGIIIIDEEHSSSYKQENIPKYNAIDIALKRGKTYNCPVILGSATPSIETYTRAKIGVYKLLEMKERVNKRMPLVTLVDMKDEFKKGNRILSSIVKEKINDRLEKNEQVIVLLNRRGFSTVITCKSCGYTHKCPNCDIPLIYHKSGNIMKCHYCDYKAPKLLECPNCHSKDINSFGMGTEKLQEILTETFEKAKTIRMDADTTRRKNAYEKIINDFKDQKYNILVGTQMIAKGLDFPKVSLVVVVNGDASLNVPDFRSAERTYELLSQVSGRSGRADIPGEVIIQGFNMNHYSIIAAKENDYTKFYNEEMNIRKVLKYPPYFNLCLIKISGKDYNKVLEQANKISIYLKNNIKDIVLGPSSANIPRINNIYYIQIIIKYKKTKDIINELKFIKKIYKKFVTIDIDLNPIKM